jgi:hypothetical protein
MRKFYEIKKHFFAYKEGIPELQHAINSHDKEMIKKLITQHYEHLKAIYQLCNLLD